MSMKFNFVYSKDSLALRKVLSDLSSDCCISYQDIFNKLTKNDVYSTEPADVVVNSFLIKKLEKKLISEHQNLYYIISEEDLSCDLFDEIYYVNSEKDKILS